MDATDIKSNYFKIEWPYKSGLWKSYPEVDKAAWFTIAEARAKINSAQILFIDELLLYLTNNK